MLGFVVPSILDPFASDERIATSRQFHGPGDDVGRWADEPGEPFEASVHLREIRLHQHRTEMSQKFTIFLKNIREEVTASRKYQISFNPQIWNGPCVSCHCATSAFKGALMLRTTIAAAAILGLVLTAQANATPVQSITVDSTLPVWKNAVGGTSVNTTTNGSGNNTTYQVFWGQSGGSGQSGLGFNPAQPPSLTVNAGDAFALGTLTHYNNPIYGDALKSVDLILGTNVASATPTTQNFGFRFVIDETPNQRPCTYPGTSVCPDKISFENLTTASSFTLNGQAYTLQILGFSNDGNFSHLTTDFISEEGSTNTTTLYARFIAPTSVPEPASLAVLGFGVLGLGLIRNRKRHG